MKRVNTVLKESFQLSYFDFGISTYQARAYPEGGGIGEGSRIPLENHKAVRFLSSTDPDPLENHKATKPAFNVEPLPARQ